MLPGDCNILIITVFARSGCLSDEPLQILSHAVQAYHHGASRPAEKLWKHAPTMATLKIVVAVEACFHAHSWSKTITNRRAAGVYRTIRPEQTIRTRRYRLAEKLLGSTWRTRPLVLFLTWSRRSFTA